MDISQLHAGQEGRWWYRHPVQQKQRSISRKEIVVADVHKILHSEFHHKHAPIRKTTLNSIDVDELTSLCSFLTREIVAHPGLRESFKRPYCPVTGPNHQSQATHSYKKAMINYISRFGFDLSWAPCSYLPAFLEAMANYCESMATE